MIKAFSAENNRADFDWDADYGCGFDCVNFSLLNAAKALPGPVQRMPKAHRQSDPLANDDDDDD